MTDDIVKRLRRDLASGLSASIGDTQDAADRIEELERQTEELSAVVEELIDKNAADRIKLLEYALRSIADTPIGAEIPDRTTIWGLAKHMQETSKGQPVEKTDD